MKTYIFIPDTNIKAGFGHFYRCLKYSNFIKNKNKIIFLIKKNFTGKYQKKNLNGVKLRYIYFENLQSTLSKLDLVPRNTIIFLDTYNDKIRSINFKKFSNQHVNILDFRAKCKSDYILDHTFQRNKKFHNNNSIVKVGANYFPISKTLSFFKKEIILINFGSVKSKKLIQSSLKFLDKIIIKNFYKIIILDKYFKKVDIPKLNMKNKIFIYKFSFNIEKIYAKTFFAFGACGISLYEKCYFQIPCISKSVATNQMTNFKNFYSKGCILDFDKVTNLEMKKYQFNNEKFNKELIFVKKNIKKYFNYLKNRSHLKKIFTKFDEN